MLQGLYRGISCLGGGSHWHLRSIPVIQYPVHSAKKHWQSHPASSPKHHSDTLTEKETLDNIKHWSWNAKNRGLNGLILKRKEKKRKEELWLAELYKKKKSVEVTDIKGCHFGDCILYLAWNYRMLNNIQSKTKISNLL